MLELPKRFGDIDIYLFDQLLRGRIRPGMRVLDAGCGGGRDLVFLLREGYDVYGIDQDACAIQQVRDMAAALAAGLPAANFQIAPLEDPPFANAFSDVILVMPCSTLRRTTGSFARCSTAYGASYERADCCFAGWLLRLARRSRLSG